MVVVASREELAAQIGDVGIVDVVPLDARTGVQPEGARVQSATEVHDGGFGVDRQKLSGPIVEMRTAGGHRR